MKIRFVSIIALCIAIDYFILLSSIDWNMFSDNITGYLHWNIKLFDDDEKVSLHCWYIILSYFKPFHLLRQLWRHDEYYRTRKSASFNNYWIINHSVTKLSQLIDVAMYNIFRNIFCMIWRIRFPIFLQYLLQDFESLSDHFETLWIKGLL